MNVLISKILLLELLILYREGWYHNIDFGRAINLLYFHFILDLPCWEAKQFLFSVSIKLSQERQQNKIQNSWIYISQISMEESKISITTEKNLPLEVRKVGEIGKETENKVKTADDIDSRREKLAVLRINNEKKLIQHALNIGVLDKNEVEIKFIDQFEWRVGIRGRKGTIWEGGLYCSSMKFPKDYPDSPPLVVFDSDFQHIHINPRGEISLDFIRCKATDPTSKLIAELIRLIHEKPSIESPANVELNQIYMNDQEEYEKKIRANAERLKNKKLVNLF